MRRIGTADLAAVERLRSYHGRVDARDELGAIFEPIFRTRTAAQWFATLDSAGVPCELCNQGYWRDYLLDPWSIETGRVVEYYPGRFARADAAVRQNGPLLADPADHTGSAAGARRAYAAILADLGYSAREQEDLKRRGVVSWPEN